MLSAIKFIYSIFIICTVLISANTVNADQFLIKSYILKNTDIKIFIGENQKEAIVFHTNDIDNIKYDDLYILTSKGPLPLKGKLAKMALLNECGNPVPGIGFKKQGHDGFLMAAGKNIDKIIKYYPSQSKSSQDTKICNKGISKGENEIITNYTSNGLNGTIQQIRWKRNLTKDEVEKECDGLAKWNVQYNKSKTYKELYEECIGGEYHCKEEDRVVINLQDNSGKCLEITNSAIDCNGKAEIGVDLREFLGVLKIEYKAIKEVWLLWNAPGYEGNGIYAIEINDITKKKRLLQEWLVYNGC